MQFQVFRPPLLLSLLCAFAVVFDTAFSFSFPAPPVAPVQVNSTSGETADITGGDVLGGLFNFPDGIPAVAGIPAPLQLPNVSLSGGIGRPPVNRTFNFSNNAPTQGETKEGDMGFPFGENFPVDEDIETPDTSENNNAKCVDMCDVFRGALLCREGEVCHTHTVTCEVMCVNASGVFEQPVPEKAESDDALAPIMERTCQTSGIVCVHGTCPNDESCECDVGYDGDLCDNKQCYLDCVHGNCYLISPTTAGCWCEAGWGGTMCHEEACTLDCVHGSCIRLHGSNDTHVLPGSTEMFCSCDHRYTGKLCDRLKPKPSRDLTLDLAVGVTVPVVCLLVFVLAFYVLWRHRVIFVFRIINMFKAYEDDDDKLYDGYVSLTDTDYDFVVNVLQPKIEEMGHKLYLQERDGTAGDVKSEMILEAVEKSRRCILLLSSAYVNNEWCRFEYLIAQHETCVKLRQRIIPILLDDIDKDKKKMDKALRFIVDSVKCLRYPRPPPGIKQTSTKVPEAATKAECKAQAKYDRQLAKFWERLKLNMPKKKRVAAVEEEEEEVKSPSSLSCNSGCPLSDHLHEKDRKGVRKFFSHLGSYSLFSANTSSNKHSQPAAAVVAIDSHSFSSQSKDTSISIVGSSYLSDPKLSAFYNGFIEKELSTSNPEKMSMEDTLSQINPNSHVDLDTLTVDLDV